MKPKSLDFEHVPGPCVLVPGPHLRISAEIPSLAEYLVRIPSEDSHVAQWKRI